MMETELGWLMAKKNGCRFNLINAVAFSGLALLLTFETWTTKSSSCPSSHTSTNLDYQSINMQPSMFLSRREGLLGLAPYDGMHWNNGFGSNWRGNEDSQRFPPWMALPKPLSRGRSRDNSGGGDHKKQGKNAKQEDQLTPGNRNDVDSDHSEGGSRGGGNVWQSFKMFMKEASKKWIRVASFIAFWYCVVTPIRVVLSLGLKAATHFVVLHYILNNIIGVPFHPEDIIKSAVNSVIWAVAPLRMLAMFLLRWTKMGQELETTGDGSNVLRKTRREMLNLFKKPSAMYPGFDENSKSPSSTRFDSELLDYWSEKQASSDGSMKTGK